MRKVICVFPSMGKTFLSKVNPHYYDLDFVSYHNMERESALRLYADRIMKLPERTVLINEPAVISLLKDRTIKMVLPQTKERCLRVLRERGDYEFACHLDLNYDKWIQDWLDVAKSQHVTVLRTDSYLRCVVGGC